MRPSRNNQTNIVHVRQDIRDTNDLFSDLLTKLSVIKLNMAGRKVNQVHVIPKRM